MSDHRPPSQQRKGEYQDYKQYPPSQLQPGTVPRHAGSTSSSSSAFPPSRPHSSSTPPPAFYPGGNPIGPSPRNDDDSRNLSYERPPPLQTRRTYEDISGRGNFTAGSGTGGAGPSSSSSSTATTTSSPTKADFRYSHSDPRRMSTSAPFTSIGMPATPEVHRSSTSSSGLRSAESGRWESLQQQRGNSPPRRSTYAATVSPTTSASTVNVAMPNRRGSRGDAGLPSSYVVGSDRGGGGGGGRPLSASISTTPGYGLISISTTTAASAPSIGGKGVDQSSKSRYGDQISGGSGAVASTSSSSGKPLESLTKPTLEGFSRVRNGWKYRLIVVQNPTRARMCGFGDKDRRPLSPTLIVKLIITEEDTGKEVSPWKVNTSLFFLASDLCHAEDLMLSPRNVLVHHHAASIPTAMLQQQSHLQDYHPSLPSSQQQQQQQQQQQSYQHQHPYSHQSQSQTSHPSSHSSHPSSNYQTYPSSSISPTNVALPHLGGLYLADRSRTGDGGGGGGSAAFYTHQQQQQSLPDRSPPPLSASSASLTTVTTEHYTRNLVGAAVTSANVLKDEQDNYRIFFVLQDLSVRTEGVYRIRLMFTDLAQQDGQTNEGVSDALAETYTEPFSVYSPRRFPGMLEPTELSKKLASQGIKIAVRSDKKKRRRDSGPGGQGPSGEVDELEDEED